MNTDEYFINKYHLEIFKKINKPSFIFSHGLPGIYSKNVDNKSDYLLVWGEQIKLNYIKYGFDPNKIYVVGNPKYPLFPNKIKLRNTLKDVLVFTSSSLRGISMNGLTFQFTIEVILFFSKQYYEGFETKWGISFSG